MTDLLNLSNGLWEGRILYGVYWDSILLCSGMTRLAVCLLFVVSTSRVLLLVFRQSISRICRYNQDECNSHQGCSFLYNLFAHGLVVHSNCYNHGTDSRIMLTLNVGQVIFFMPTIFVTYLMLDLYGQPHFLTYTVPCPSPLFYIWFLPYYEYGSTLFTIWYVSLYLHVYKPMYLDVEP